MGLMYLVIGPPGCGKTTHLCDRAAEAALRFGKSKVLICSLTKAAARAVHEKGIDLPKHCVGTMHSHCYRLLDRPTLAESKLKEWNRKYGGSWAMSSNSVNLDGPGDRRSSKLVGDRAYQEVCIARARLSEIPKGYEKFWLLWSRWKRENGLLDFEDMIETARSDRCPGAPNGAAVIYLDEAQDSSASEIETLKHWGEYASVVAIGDLDQSIFTWRGACPQAFLELDIPPERRKVLELSYRVPVAVHATAVRWIEKIKGREPIVYHPRDEQGEVRRTHATFYQPQTLLKEAQKYLDRGKTVMFLGACHWHVAPIIALMKSRGIPFHNPYRLKHGGWNPLGGQRGVTAAQRMRAFLEPQTQRIWSVHSLHKWTSAMQEKGVLKHGAKKMIKSWTESRNPPELDDEILADVFCDGVLPEAMTSVWDGRWDWFVSRLLGSKAESFKFPVAVAMNRGIAALSETPKIMVGTIHSVKGGEADCVFVFPDLSRAASREWNSATGRNSLIRLFYVAMTRARESLILCAPAGPMHVQWS